MNALEILSGVITIPVYLLLFHHLKKGNTKENLLSWILWVILDVIVLESVISKHGNFILQLSYVIGGTCIVITIFKSSERTWDLFKLGVVLLVGVCIYLREKSGPSAATVMGTIAVLIAGVPEIIDAYKKPEDTSFLVWLGFMLACVISIFAGKDWSIEERCYPTCCSVLCFVIAALSSRKFFRPVPVPIL